MTQKQATASTANRDGRGTKNANSASDDTTPIARVIAALDRAGRGQIRNGMMRCPAHDDRNASLSVSVGDDGRVLLKCFAGCSTEDICTALGLKMADLFESWERVDTPDGVTLAQYAEAKRLPVELLTGLGLEDVKYFKAPAVKIPYFLASGEDGPVRYRMRLQKRVNGDGRFTWRKGSKLVPYGVWRLADAIKARYVVLEEGESDAQTLWHHGIPALGIPGANNWRDDWAELLSSIPTIYVVVEPDKGGEALRAKMLASAMVDRISFVSLGKHKDASGLHCADPDGFGVAFRAALDAAEPAREIVDAERDERESVAWAACARLAESCSILDELISDMQKLGAVGEATCAKLIYLAMTSRMFPRPVSVVVKGPSSAGKSFTTETVLRFFPDSAQYKLSGMSEKFLLYDETPLANKMMIFAEADGFNGDFQSYIVRTLLSEGRLIYGTVDRDGGDNAGMSPRLIEREGPTGAIITTTAIKLHPENETRLLSIPVDDTANQTASILAALADGSRNTVDFTRWHALATWLEAGPHEVAIPFAPALATLIPPVAVRLRRDFGQLLALIRSHALLHRASRETAEGAIVATIDDYAVVRGLVREIIGEAAAHTVPPTMRETVRAVEGLLSGSKAHASIGEIGRALKLDKASASRRVRAATAAGYLENAESKRGVAAKIVMADPLPEERELLPTPEVLHGCAVASGDSERPSLDGEDRDSEELWL